MVRADHQRLLQVAANLISNAAKYADKESKIRVELTAENNMAVFSVTNDGAGIPQEQQPFLFRKFQQLGNALDQRLPGAGLGLNICKHIIDAHYGVISFESIVNQQTRFSFKLPLLNVTT
jgi:signal transduction histidine kinase